MQVYVNPQKLEMEERGAYVHVFLQEIDRATTLTKRIRSSLADVGACLKGDIQMSEPIAALMTSLANNSVPAEWERAAYPSLLPLGAWVLNLHNRVRQLSEWTNDMQLPKVTWLSGLFVPQSFLTAVAQVRAFVPKVTILARFPPRPLRLSLNQCVYKEV